VFVGPASDAASGTVPIIVQVEGGGRKAPIGSSVRVQLEGSASRQPTPVRLPQEALQDPAALEGDTVILFVNHAGRAQARQVQLVKTDGNSITVRGPVSASDQVILPPPGGLSDGEAVVPREGP
jgi:multidrug efflux pump subunit AcrA (membrane-fusion protein)